ncbi:hypothetical protein PLANTIT3_30259 [Plantibacter sp. T3]|nr:hypothetical protein PLANTIT3_30259 [Plantibacter sp. T3]
MDNLWRDVEAPGRLVSEHRSPASASHTLVSFSPQATTKLHTCSSLCSSGFGGLIHSFHTG